MLALGEHRQADDAEQHVQQRRGEAAPEPERARGQQDAERLAGERHGIAGDEDVDAGGQRDERGADEDQGQVPGPRVQALGDADRDQEVADRQAALLGGQAIEARHADRHTASGRVYQTRFALPGRLRGRRPGAPAHQS